MKTSQSHQANTVHNAYISTAHCSHGRKAFNCDIYPAKIQLGRWHTTQVLRPSFWYQKLVSRNLYPSFAHQTRETGTRNMASPISSLHFDGQKRRMFSIKMIFQSWQSITINQDKKIVQ